MGDLEGDFRFSRRADRFTHGFNEVIVLVPHVGGVETAVPRRHPAEFGDFILAGETAGGIFEPGRKPPGAFRHGLVHERLHRIDLPRAGRYVVVSDCVSANGALAHQRYEIQPDALFLQCVEQAGEIRPFDVHAVSPPVTVLQRLEPAFRKRCER